MQARAYRRAGERERQKVSDKERKGEIVDARGFDLTPLFARAPDFAARCKEIEVETKLCCQLRGDVTAARNAVRDLCAADDAGLLITIAARLDALTYPLPRCATSLEIAAAAEAFVTLADDARDILYAGSELSEMTGYACQNGRHSARLWPIHAAYASAFSMRSQIWRGISILSRRGRDVKEI